MNKKLLYGLECAAGLATAMGGWSILAKGDHFTGGILTLIGALLIGHGARSLRLQKKPAANIPAINLPVELSKEQAELAETIFAKARSDYRRIEAVSESLQDRELAQQLDRMQSIAQRMLEYLSAHPELFTQARRFSDTYQDRAASLAEEYRELEATGVTSGKVAETKARIKAALFSFDEAYEAEFSRLLHTKLLDVDAELDVLKETMKADGALETKDFDLPEEAPLSDGLAGQAGPPVNRGGRKERPQDEKKTIFSQGGKLPEDMHKKVLKDRVICGILAIFLGSFGAHRFYRGQTALGIIYALFFWTAIPAWIGMIEGLRYLLLPEKDYYEQYIRGKGQRK